MRRTEALAAIALAPLLAAAACGHSTSGLVATTGSPLKPTAFGSHIYPSDDIERTLSLLAACGSTLIRSTAVNQNFAYFDALFPAATTRGMRVIVISDYAPQPVDLATYTANAVAFHRRYASYNPIWEIWNEPNLAYYWGANPDSTAYAKLAVATAVALRAAGAQEILSGGTSGIDLSWLYNLRTHGVFDVVTGCAVHSYKDPSHALNDYIQAASLMPPGVRLYTTEACVVNGQTSFLRDMWNIHRYLGLPALIWCEFRDGTAGPLPPYTDPMGLVTSDYTRKDVYYTAQSLVNG